MAAVHGQKTDSPRTETNNALYALYICAYSATRRVFIGEKCSGCHFSSPLRAATPLHCPHALRCPARPARSDIYVSSESSSSGMKNFFHLKLRHPSDVLTSAPVSPPRLFISQVLLISLICANSFTHFRGNCPWITRDFRCNRSSRNATIA